MTLRIPSARHRGVTLIELMIVLIVIGVLAAIAVPAYRSHVLRVQRTDATAALLRIQSAQEKFFVQNGRYATDLVAQPSAGGLGLSNRSERGGYSLSVALTATGYFATAFAIATAAPAEDLRCQTFKITDAGVRSAFDERAVDRTSECWR